MNITFFVINVLSAMGLYFVNAAFTFSMFVSGSVGWDRALQGAFAVAFELSKIGLWVEGLMKRKVIFMLLGVFFSVGSLVTASVGLTGKEDDKRELVFILKEAQSSDVTSAKLRVSQLEQQLTVELARLASGSVEYRTDAMQTRAAMAELETKLRTAQQDLSQALSIQAEKITAGSSVESNPFTVLAQKLMLDPSKSRFGFSIYQALMLELGGLATTAAAIYALRRAPGWRMPVRLNGAPAPMLAVASIRSDEGSGAQTEEVTEAEDSPEMVALAEIAYGARRSKNGTFPSVQRAWREANIDPETYREVVRRGVLAGVLRNRRHRPYVVPGVTPSQFLEEVREWPN